MNNSSNHKESPDNLFHGYEKSSQSYSSYSNFPNTTTSGSTSIPTSGGTGARPHVNKDAFSDLLGGFGSSRTNNTDDNKQPKTVNQIRREKMAKTVDPEQLKVTFFNENFSILFKFDNFFKIENCRFIHTTVTVKFPSVKSSNTISGHYKASK